MTITLYDYVLSGNCYKVRLFASLLGVELNRIGVDFHPGREHKSDAFLKSNPAGTLPVLKDGSVTLTRSDHILRHLADHYDASGFWALPQDDEAKIAVEKWLGFADRLTDTLGVARLHTMLGHPLDVDQARAMGVQSLRQLEAHLTEQEFDGFSFLLSAKPSIADIACFPYTALAEDAGVSLTPYPAIGRWLLAIRRLDGFIEMPGIHRLHSRPTETVKPSHKT